MDADCNDNGTSIWKKKSGLIFLQTTHFRLWKISFWVFLLVKVAFGTIANGTKLFLKFDWSRCKSDIWWYYMPKDVETDKNSVFISSDFLLPLLIQWILTQVKKMGKNIFFVRKTIVKRILL